MVYKHLNRAISNNQQFSWKWYNREVGIRSYTLYIGIEFRQVIPINRLNVKISNIIQPNKFCVTIGEIKCFTFLKIAIGYQEASRFGHGCEHFVPIADPGYKQARKLLLCFNKPISASDTHTVYIVIWNWFRFERFSKWNTTRQRVHSAVIIRRLCARGLLCSNFMILRYEINPAYRLYPLWYQEVTEATGRGDYNVPLATAESWCSCRRRYMLRSVWYDSS